MLPSILASVVLALVADAGVDGYWKTIDDETGQPRSVVHITVQDGVAQGTIVQLFRQPDEEADPLCDDCEGELKTHRVVGMRILEGLTQAGEKWSGGTILDPGNGKTYKVFIEPEEDGTLKVRGFIGFSLLGRTQHWYRVQAPDPAVRTYLLDADGNAMPYAFADGRVASEAEITAHLADDAAPAE